MLETWSRHNVEWSDFERSRENPLPLSPAWCREEGDIVGHAKREGGHPGPRGFSRRTQEHHRSRRRSVGRAAGGEEDSMPLIRLGEEPSLPTPSVAAQPTAEVEIQDSTIWDGSSHGEPLVRPNNGRHVAIQDWRHSAGQEHVLWKVLSL